MAVGRKFRSIRKDPPKFSSIQITFDWRLAVRDPKLRYYQSRNLNLTQVLIATVPVSIPLNIMFSCIQSIHDAILGLPSTISWDLDGFTATPYWLLLLTQTRQIYTSGWKEIITLSFCLKYIPHKVRRYTIHKVLSLMYVYCRIGNIIIIIIKNKNFLVVLIFTYKSHKIGTLACF